METEKITAATVRADFNDLLSVVHYTRAAHELGLWASERALIERFFPDRNAPLLEAGCGAGRVAIGLWSLGYRNITAFDFAEELVDQAISLATERGASGIKFLHADATALGNAVLQPAHGREDSVDPERGRPAHAASSPFSGALFLFNGLMQIPGRANRRAALGELCRCCAPGAPLETLRWTRGDQDPRLVEFGDRYFEDEAGRTFMHLPDRREILEDLAATGWSHAFDAMRSEVAKESRAVIDFSDECRFWAATR